MKILNQMGPRVSAQILRAVPDVEIEDVPLEGPLDPGLSGDALLSFRRASTLLEATKVVPWLHVCGAGVEGMDPESVRGRAGRHLLTRSPRHPDRGVLDGRDHRLREAAARRSW